MACKSCGASSQSSFTGEVAIHFPGLKNIDKLPVFVFPEFLVCLDCGITEFALSETALGLLAPAEYTPLNVNANGEQVTPDSD